MTWTVLSRMHPAFCRYHGSWKLKVLSIVRVHGLVSRQVLCRSTMPVRKAQAVTDSRNTIRRSNTSSPPMRLTVGTSPSLKQPRLGVSRRREAPTIMLLPRPTTTEGPRKAYGAYGHTSIRTQLQAWQGSATIFRLANVLNFQDRCEDCHRSILVLSSILFIEVES